MAETFLSAFEALLRSRKIRVPAGLRTAPPEAYARQPASTVGRLADLDDAALVAQAQKIAGHAKRQSQRAADEWDRSPLVQELRRRKLKEPAKPKRVVGAVLSSRRPLAEWSDRELLEAAKQWSSRANRA